MLGFLQVNEVSRMHCNNVVHIFNGTYNEYFEQTKLIGTHVDQIIL